MCERKDGTRGTRLIDGDAKRVGLYLLRGNVEYYSQVRIRLLSFLCFIAVLYR
jgi:hypothetical protein